MEEFDEEEITAPQIYRELVEAYVNERNCPDLRKNRNELVECMMDQIKQMEENLKSLPHDDFIVVPHRMEVDRIRYVIASYLRVRLEKIEAYAVFLLKRDRAIPNEEDRYMSKAEFAFAEQYLENLRRHFQGEAFRYMPSLLYEYGGNLDVEVKPNMKSAVVFKMLKTVEGILLNGITYNLNVNTNYIFPYKDMKVLLEDKSAICV